MITTLLELFWSFFQVGLFSIGGGYVALPLIQNQVVEINQWLTPLEFTDIVTISQVTPGPIAINAATFVGTKVAGIPGAIAATIGCILPSTIIVMVLAKVYYKYRNLNHMQSVLAGLRPAVVGMIASAGVSLILLAFFRDGTVNFAGGNLNVLALAIFAVGFFILRKWKPDPIWVMAGSAVVGILAYVLGGLA